MWRKNRFALDVRLATPRGWNLAVFSGYERPWRREAERQDCEAAAS